MGFSQFVESLQQPPGEGVVSHLEGVISGNGVEALESYLSTGGSVNDIDKGGVTLLYWAVVANDKEKAREILKRKPNDLATALEHAAQGSDEEWLRILFAAGADPLAKSPTFGGYIAVPHLHLASRKVFNEYARLIYGREIDFDKAADGLDPLV